MWVCLPVMTGSTDLRIGTTWTTKMTKRKIIQKCQRPHFHQSSSDVFITIALDKLKKLNKCNQILIYHLDYNLNFNGFKPFLNRVFCPFYWENVIALK